MPERIYDSPVRSTNPAVDVLSHLFSGFNIGAIHCLLASSKLQYKSTLFLSNGHALNLRVWNIDFTDSAGQTKAQSFNMLLEYLNMIFVGLHEQNTVNHSINEENNPDNNHRPKGNTVTIHLPGRSIPSNTSMTSLEQQVGDALLRCHRSYLINPKFVKRIDSNDFVLTTGERIPIRINGRKSTISQYHDWIMRHMDKVAD